MDQVNDTIRNDTVYLRALKRWRKGQFDLAQGTKNEKISNESWASAEISDRVELRWLQRTQ